MKKAQKKKQLGAVVSKKHKLKLAVPDITITTSIANGATYTYDAAPEVAGLITTLVELLSPAEAVRKAVGKVEGISVDERRTAVVLLAMKRMHKFLPFAVQLYYEQLPIKIEEAVHELMVEVTAQTVLQMHRDGIWKNPPRKGSLRKILEVGERKKKKRLKLGRGGARIEREKFNWDDKSHDLLLRNYKALKPMWKDAKKVYEEHQRINGNGWIAAVKASLVEYALPEDLIQRLGALDNYESSPAVIAREHAARLCGCKAYLYSSKRLGYHLRTAKKKAARKERPLDIKATVSYAE